MAAIGRQGPHQRVSADRAWRRLRSGPDGFDRDAGQPEHAAAPVDDDMVATPVEGGYRINGRKLWATNGTIADIVVVMAKVPKSEGHRGGSARSCVPYNTEGITVLHRNAFMGLRGIENSVTVLKDVFVPEENRIARRATGSRSRSAP